MAEFTRVFIRVSRLLRENYPALNVCTINGSPVRVIQWQCGGEFTVDPKFGVKKEDALFLDKSRKFIEEALATDSDLVLTPEYSFPFTVIEEILNDPTHWPRPGQLWCLGTQGENRDFLLRRFDDWRKISGVNLISIATEELEVKSFVSPLIYFFRTNDQRLCVLPQFKTGQMADPRNVFEGPNLCLGKHIFIFDLGQEDCQNVFLSLICADALHIKASELISHIPERYIILFHPQLNPDPRYHLLVSFRKDFYMTGQKDTRILTLNWATNTVGCSGGHHYFFNIPWSAYFKNPKSPQPLNDQSQRSNKERNHKKGTPYIVSDRIEVWFSSRYEHCKLFVISKGDNGNSALAVVTRDDPTTEDCYTYDEQTKLWTAGQFSCASNIKDIFLEFSMPMDFPYPICSTDIRQCDNCKKTDYFYGSLLGKFEQHEILCSDECVARLLVGSDVNSDLLRKKKFDLLMHLKRLLSEGKFPNALKYLANNYTFKISKDFPMQGKAQFNIVPIRQTHTDAEALVVITDEITLSRVEKLVKELIDNMSEKYRNQILIYYKLPGNGYVFYDNHLSETSYRNPKFSSNPTSIMRSVMSKIINRGGH